MVAAITAVVKEWRAIWSRSADNTDLLEHSFKKLINPPPVSPVSAFARRIGIGASAVYPRGAKGSLMSSVNASTGPRNALNKESVWGICNPGVCLRNISNSRRSGAARSSSRSRPGVSPGESSCTARASTARGRRPTSSTISKNTESSRLWCPLLQRRRTAGSGPRTPIGIYSTPSGITARPSLEVTRIEIFSVSFSSVFKRSRSDRLSITQSVFAGSAWSLRRVWTRSSSSLRSPRSIPRWGASEIKVCAGVSPPGVQNPLRVDFFAYSAASWDLPIPGPPERTTTFSRSKELVIFFSSASRPKNRPLMDRGLPAQWVSSDFQTAYSPFLRSNHLFNGGIAFPTRPTIARISSGMPIAPPGGCLLRTGFASTIQDSNTEGFDF